MSSESTVITHMSRKISATPEVNHQFCMRSVKLISTLRSTSLTYLKEGKQHGMTKLYGIADAQYQFGSDHIRGLFFAQSSCSFSPVVVSVCLVVVSTQM